MGATTDRKPVSDAGDILHNTWTAIGAGVITAGRTNSTHRDALRSINECWAEFCRRCRWILGYQRSSHVNYLQYLLNYK
jgi:hypothetical protein